MGDGLYRLSRVPQRRQRRPASCWRGGLTVMGSMRAVRRDETVVGMQAVWVAGVGPVYGRRA